MNALLYGDLPEQVTVFGAPVPVRWSYHDVMRLFEMAKDPDVPDSVKGSLAVRMFFREDVFRMAAESGFPDPGEEITKAVVSFLSGGREESVAGVPAAAPLFDFDCDAELIYGAFMETYGIDLAERELHWWKFRALLRSLPAETEFMRVLAVRSGDVSSLPEGADRARLRRLRAKFALPVRGTAEERARLFGNAVRL